MKNIIIIIALAAIAAFIAQCVKNHYKTSQKPSVENVVYKDSTCMQ